MTVESVLVAGATGNQGGAVADHLLERGVKVHALTRSHESDAARALEERGATVVEGDMNEKDSLVPLIDDVDGVYSVTAFFEAGYEGEVEQGTNMAEVAAETGVEHYVFSSVGGTERDTGLPHFESKYEIEQRIHDLDLSATIIRPVSFMQNFETQREDVLTGTLAQPLAEGVSMQLVDVNDIGALVAEAFADPDRYVGEAIELAGDELTLEEMAAVFSEVTGVDVEAQHIPVDVAREQMSEEFVAFFEWVNESGYDADIRALERDYDLDLTRLGTYLREHGWASE